VTIYIPDPWLRRWAGRVHAGGSPWRLVRLSQSASGVLDRAYGPSGVRVDQPGDRRVVDALVDRGVLHPRPAPRSGPHDVTVVVPAYGRPQALARCLRGLGGLDVLVIDDATPAPSPLGSVARAAGARYHRLALNQGPAAARNAGLALASTTLVAFVDSDCEPDLGWLDRLVPFFDDPRVAAVAPRVAPSADEAGVLARFERVSSALDMGRHPALVRPGARLGFVPSAALVVRRDAGCVFDEALRLGEDVDLVWRLADGGAHVRYEPGVVVRHDSRGSLRRWAVRRFEYGTSAVDLEDRHPGRLPPVRASPWNLATLAAVGLGQPVAGLGVSAVAAGLLARRLRGKQIGASVAVRVMAAGLVADAVAVGQALRREYWPLTALAVLAAPRSRMARLAMGLAVAPVLAEWVRERPRLDPVRFAGLRLLADAAYGTGVLASCWRRRRAGPITPRLRQRDPVGRSPSVHAGR
jgi:mycofactocin glycosyltransferase